LTFLSTRWSVAFRTKVENTTAESLETAKKIRVIPKKDKGKGSLVPLDRKQDERGVLYSFIYQRDTYVLNGELRFNWFALSATSSGDSS
jgi:cation-transporting ATPase 13A1